MQRSDSLRQSLEAIVGAGRVLDRPAERVAWSADAGFYQLIPRAVVFAGSVAEVQGLFHFSRAAGIPMTFRAAGTSLSGQAISDGILVEVARHWRAVEVMDGGARVRVQPGAIGAHVNLALRPWSAKLGPDPASIGTCTVGGILSNIASGMCCLFLLETATREDMV
jgi:D-lactate dehydrogenase